MAVRKTADPFGRVSAPSGSVGLDLQGGYDSPDNLQTLASNPLNSTGLVQTGGTVRSDGSGSVTYGQRAPSFEEQLRLRKQYNDMQQDRLDQRLQQFEMSASQGPTVHVERGTGANAQMETAARDAAFARAKDKTGMVARSSVEALANMMAGRNMLGSGLEAKGQAAIANEGQGNLGNVIREQAIKDADRAEHVADENFQGELQQSLAQSQIRAQQSASMRALIAQSGVVY